jgi:hypothetical protein
VGAHAAWARLYRVDRPERVHRRAAGGAGQTLGKFEVRLEIPRLPLPDILLSDRSATKPGCTALLGRLLSLRLQNALPTRACALPHQSPTMSTLCRIASSLRPATTLPRRSRTTLSRSRSPLLLPQFTKAGVVVMFLRHLRPVARGREDGARGRANRTGLFTLVDRDARLLPAPVCHHRRVLWA